MYQLSFFDYDQNRIVDSIANRLKTGFWRFFDYNSYLHNYLLPTDKINLQKNVFPQVLPIPIGTRWNPLKKSLDIDLYYPQNIQKIGLTEYLEWASSFFDSIRYKKIGVHLSGGLDSSLIMSTMTALNIPYVAVGIRGETFEFRTERQIQDYYLERACDGNLLSLEDFPFYDKLTETPFSQLPPENIKSISSAHAMAEEFKRLGCDIVLSGQGGDSVFVDDVQNFKNLSFNIGNEFTNDPQTIDIYQSVGLELRSFYENTTLIDILASLRQGQKEDPLKLWARNYFKTLLPRELSDFAYVSDYFGYSKHGLNLALPQIKDIIDEAFALTNNQFFNIPLFNKIDILGFEYKDYLEFCGILSAAVWVYNMNLYEKS